MTLKEQIIAMKNELAGLKARIEADDAEAIERGTQLTAEIEAKEKELEAAEKKAALLNSIKKTGKQEEAGMTVMEEFAKKAAALKNGNRTAGASAYFKAATDVVTAPQIADIDRQVAPQPRRRAIADFLSNATISGNAITYFRQGAFEGTPAAVAQGAKKPQVSTSFTPITLPLSKIAAYIKETDEILLDAEFLASEVRNSLIYRVGVVEDNTIIGAIDGTSGILTRTKGTGDNALADAIIGAITDIRGASAYDASVVIINPADFLALMTAKDGNNQYYGGGYFLGAYGNGQYGMPRAIWDVPVFTSSAITAGTAIVAAREAVKVWRKSGLEVRVYEQNEDDAICNRVTLLGEERLACAVVDLGGVCKIS